MLTPNGRISKRKTVQLMIALTILAWATQTLLHQWGFGAELRASTVQEPGDDSTGEKFVPGNSSACGATLEMRTEATIVGEEVRLKQVCRWSDADSSALAPIAELIVARITPDKPFKGISINEIKSTLIDAHVNMAGINFVGPISCTINRSDAQIDQRDAMQEWIDAHKSVDQPDAAPATAPIAPVAKAPAPSDGSVHSLRQLLTEDIAQRLNVPIDTLQVNFSPLNENVLNLSEPLFKFQIDSIRVRNLGPVEWDVTLISGTNTRKISISADARAWQNQLVLAKPLAFQQLIQDEDVVEKRVLADALPEDPLATKAQAVGQEASRPLKIGAVLTARMIDPVELVKSGQLVTVTVSHGSVSIKTVALAMESGSMGQTIKVKNELTRDIYDIVLTGPQQGSLNADAPPGKVASSE